MIIPLTEYSIKPKKIHLRSFLSFVDAHVPEGRLQRNGVSTARAVAQFLQNTLVTALKE
jgi:hypothetical protein